jgi:predicted nucleic acid-binding protein
VILVVDASVALKGFFRVRKEETHRDRALAILAGIDRERFYLVQPPHFLAEVAAVLARENPENAEEDLLDLQRVEWRLIEDELIYATAVGLSVHLQQHVFDTLYHATALHAPGATLITADPRYYRRAREKGCITLLADFELPLL